MNAEVISALSLALGLGLLIGLQRQRSQSKFGGIRTFPLIALLGAICGLLSQEWGGYIIAGGLVAVALTALNSNLRRSNAIAKSDSDLKSNTEPKGSGQTTETAALLTFATGALLTTKYQPYAIAVAGLTAVLLQSKRLLHNLSGKLTERDLQAIMRFAVVSLIVLPLVPDTEFGPYSVLNPRNIWWMVVLIVGIGLAGYISLRIFGERAGGWLSGILGGLVSSTATTVAYAHRVRENTDAITLATLVIVVASTVAAARVVVEVAIVARCSALEIAVPLAVFLGLMIVISLTMTRRSEPGQGAAPESANPAELTSALLFAAIYAVIELATVAAKDYFGDNAMYGVAIISGFVDVDAITLSTSRQAAGGGIGTSTAWRVILVAFLTNLVFKTGMAGLIGSRALLKRLLLPMGAALTGGTALLIFWPNG